MDTGALASTSAYGVLAPESLAAYRTAVDAVVFRSRQPTRHGTGTFLDLIDGQPGLDAVFDAAPGGRDAVVRRLARELATFRPSSRSNAADPAALLKILLLHQIDVAWWSTAEPFADAAAVESSPQLVSLTALRDAGRLGFHFRTPNGLAGRARNYAVRRWAPDLEPRSSGLSHPAARPAIVAVLNDVAARFADAVPQWRRGLWVNCIVRSVADQQRLRELGYSAFLPSSHCAGFAADIEMTWLRAHGVAGPLQEILVAARDAGVLNVIDEGQAWHVCLNPARVVVHERMFRQATGEVSR